MKRITGEKRLILVLLPVVFILTLSSILIIRESSNSKRLDYRSFRAEGLSIREAAPSAIKYIRKYMNKSFEAPDSIKDFFNEIATIEREATSGNSHDSMSLSIAFVGDIMWIRNGWDSFLDENVRLWLQQFDMVFGNLETPVDPSDKTPSFLPDYAKYNSEPGLISSFRRDNGENIFTALSLANNHAFDRGVPGLKKTLEFLQKEGVIATGASPPGKEQNDYVVIERSGIRTGFYAAGWGLNAPSVLADGLINFNTLPGIAPLIEEETDVTRVAEILKEMERDSIDFKIVFLHWGYEYELFPDAAIMKMGRQIADAGADMVIGSHPHVIQPVEIWPGPDNSTGETSITRQSLIAYSMGNFATAMYTPLCRLGVIESVKITKNTDTGKTDWILHQRKYVYNKPPGRKTDGRKLLLLEDYLKTVDTETPKRAKRIRDRIRLIINP